MMNMRKLQRNENQQGHYLCNAALNPCAPIILIARFMLYTRKCNNDSALTFSVLLVRKYEYPHDRLTVPHGCSTSCLRC